MIHPTAIIHPGARLAEGVSVGAYSLIGEHVEIGEGTRIGPHVVIEGHTRIGRDNEIFQFCSIGAQPQDKKYDAEPTRLEIGRSRDRHRMDHGSLVAVTRLAHVEAEVGDELFRKGKLQIPGGESLGEIQLESGGQAGLARIDPVGVPGRIHVELESDGKCLARLDRAVAGEEPGLHVAVANGSRLRGERGRQQAREEQEPGKEKSR